MYSTLVESLKRLYKRGKVDEAKLLSMIEKGTLKQEEFEYITL